MKKINFLMLLLIVVFASCRKTDRQSNSGTGLPQLQKISGVASDDMMLEYRWTSPYSLKVVRALREHAAATGSDSLQMVLNAPLKADNYFLYYVIDLVTEDQAAALHTWMEADSQNMVVRYPVDSVSMYPHLFGEDVMEAYDEHNARFYATIPMGTPLPNAMGATILDTLYVPDADERALDFMLNLWTANFSNGYINYLQGAAPGLYDFTMRVHNEERYVPQGFDPIDPGTGNDWRNPFGTANNGQFFTPRELFDNGGMTGITNPVRRSRGISFRENTLDVNEGIRGLRVVATRFVVFQRITMTDINGEFEVDLPRFGFVGINYIFKNTELQIRGTDFSHHTVAGKMVSGLKAAFLAYVPVMHFQFCDPFNNINDLVINFAHGTKKALWGLTYNAVQEANGYTIDLNMRNGTKFLDVLCNYAQNGGPSAAPMLRYVYNFLGGPDYIFRLFQLSAYVGTSLPGVLPDMIITGQKNDPEDTHELRHTIYHEYGHTLHYFKANVMDSDHWKRNIALSPPPGYGDDINDVRGSYFALSEGWADFIGHTYNFRKYNTNATHTETNRWTGVPRTGNYQFLLEEVPTFNNNFIARGLFYDLTDAWNQAEQFDDIEGFTINQIYQHLTPFNYTIQDFRTSWENMHPDINNAALFNEYLNR